MALEKDQERPISPSGSRKIKMKNMNYILDMPVSGGNSAHNTSGFNSNYNSASKKDESHIFFNNTGNSIFITLQRC